MQNDDIEIVRQHLFIYLFIGVNIFLSTTVNNNF